MKPGNESGYSLLEVMISLVVLGIAFLALIAAQLGTLNGYVSARDESEAAELGRRVAQILQLQGSQWIFNVDHDSSGGTVDTFDPTSPYSSAVTPFDEPNPIRASMDANGAWINLNDFPVDVRLNRAAPSISTDHLGGKFCIFVRSGQMSTFTDFASGNFTTAAMRFQIAIVYPGPNAVLTDCTVDNQVTSAQLSDVGDPTADPFVPPPLETAGFRVSYFGTVVVRRAHLAN